MHRPKTRKFISQSTAYGFALAGLIGIASLTGTLPANAASCTSCKQGHETLHKNTRKHFDDQMELTKEWIVNEWFNDNVLPSLKAMTAELNVVEQQRTETLGRFMDATDAKETVTAINTARAGAQKSFTPNPTVGKIASQARALPASREKGVTVASAINARIMSRHLGNGTSGASRGVASDTATRVNQYRSNGFCDPNDNGGQSTFCGGGGSAEMRNADINFAGMMTGSLTMDGVNMDDGTTSPQEEALYAMSANFVGQPLPHIDESLLSNASVTRDTGDNLFLRSRSIATKTSFLASRLGANFALYAEGDPTSKDQIHAQKQNEGYTPEETKKMVGENPSVMAQYHTLAHMGTDPNFYSDLAGMNEEQLTRLKSSMKGMKSTLNRQISDHQNGITMTQALLLELDIADREQRANSAIRASVRDVAEGN